MRRALGRGWGRGVRAWVAGRIRKVARRARGAHWQAAQEFPGVTVTVQGAEVRALVPGRVAGLPKEIARGIQDTVPQVAGAGLTAPIAYRWKTQFNENAKLPSFAVELPELDHNEIVGWSEGQGARFCLIALRHPDEHPDVRSRFPLSIEIAESAGIVSEEVASSGRSALSRLLSLIAVGDLSSVYLALARDVDPTPVDAITRLKSSVAGA